MTLRRLLAISRPRFWLYEAGTFAIGVAVAIQTTGAWDWLLPVWFLYFLIPANLLIYGINDVFDYETDRNNPKKQGYEGLLAPRDHFAVLWTALLTSAAFLWLLAFEPIEALVPFGIFALCAVFYSAPPIRAKARPILDSLFSAGHYVATGWFAYVVAGGEGTPWIGIIAGMCWAIAMHAYSAVPDINADKQASLQTIATLLGGRATIVLCALLYSAAALVATRYLGLIVTLTLLLPYLILMRISLQHIDREDQLLRIYRLFPWLNALTGAAVWWVIVLA